MRVKQLFPIVALLLAGGVVLGVFWLLRPRDEKQISRALLDHVRARMVAEGKREGEHFTVGAIDILRRDDDQAVASVGLNLGAERRALFFQVRRHGADWTVEHDLEEHFRAFSAGEGFAKGVSERLARLWAERWRDTATVTMDGKPFLYQLVREGSDVAAKCRTAFFIPRIDGKQERIEYVEDFQYGNGAWKPVVPGQILQFRSTK